MYIICIFKNLSKGVKKILNTQSIKIIFAKFTNSCIRCRSIYKKRMVRVFTF